MFDKAVLLGASQGGELSLGQLAEAPLFYRSVHLVLDRRGVCDLVKRLGVGGFVSLLKRGTVTTTYVQGMPATASVQMGPLTAHGFVIVSSVPKEVPAGLLRGRKQSKLAELAETLLRVGLSSADTKKVVTAISDMAPARSLATKDFGGDLTRLALADLKDQEYSSRAIRDVLLEMLPASLVPDDCTVRIEESDQGFYLFGKLRIDEIEAARLKAGIPGPPLTEAAVIGRLLTARVDLALGSHYNGDFFASRESSNLVRLRCESLLRRTGLHREQISAFEDVVLDGSPSVAEVINSGDRTFDEFLRLLDKAKAFRNWAHGIHPDRQMVTAYLEEVTREGWLQSWGGKSIRYVLGLAAGFDADSALGTAWSTLDAFGLDALGSRWRASHFVEKRLKPFVGN